ncbi:MAG: glycosyl hydrolase 53 family protein [Clostridiales bacterium]|nr:glycosyl hydrolase 53 family protein [Clostridiales bacterium]
MKQYLLHGRIRCLLAVGLTAVLLGLSACGSTVSGSSDAVDSAVTPSSTTPVGGLMPFDMQKSVGVTLGDIDLVTEDNMHRMQEAGIDLIRLNIPYPFEPDGVTPTANYMAVRRAAVKLTEEGFHLMCQTFWPGGIGYDSRTGKVGWISNLPEVYDGFDDPYFTAITAQAVKYIAEDYRDLCAWWLVSNEPDINVYTGSMTPDQIAAYLHTGAKALKSVNPHNRVGINLMVSVNPAYSMQILQKAYGGDGEGLFDFVGLDSYFGTLMEGSPESWGGYIDQFSALSGKPVVITEWSYSSYAYKTEDGNHDVGTANPVCRNKRFQAEWEGHERGEASQAEYVTACLTAFQNNPQVIGSIWYAYSDYEGACWECGDTGCPMYSSWGLVGADGSPKPAYEAMKALVGS